MIPWVDVIEREPGTDNSEQVLLSYPFPDIDVSITTIAELKEAFTKMKDPIMKDCYETRLHFIMNSWHPRNFIKVSIKEWKYKT